MTGILFNEGEMDRICVIKKVLDRQYSQKEAGEELGLSERQIRRIIKRFKSEGVEGIKKNSPGKSHPFSQELKTRIIKLVRGHYHDFGPQFASEKLYEVHKVHINRETLRQWMMEEGIWKGRLRKKARIHQQRERRSSFGELVQIDGSHHDWFEGRAPKCCLLVFIDDATSKLIGLRFEEKETTLGYMRLTKEHLGSYGRPLAYYSDKHSIFITTREHAVDGRLEDTQFQRALRSLNITLICAHSSQAKGRVERANKTLQDRLIKEMRLRNISSIEEGNAYAKEFILEYNRKFAIDPVSAEDSHRPVHHTPDQLRRILSIHIARKLSKNLEFSYLNKVHKIVTNTPGYRLRHKEIILYKHLDGKFQVMSGTNELPFTTMEVPYRRYRVDSKEINQLVDKVKAKTLPEELPLPTQTIVPTQVSVYGTPG